MAFGSGNPSRSRTRGRHAARASRDLGRGGAPPARRGLGRRGPARRRWRRPRLHGRRHPRPALPGAAAARHPARAAAAAGPRLLPRPLARRAVAARRQADARAARQFVHAPRPASAAPNSPCWPGPSSPTPPPPPRPSPPASGIAARAPRPDACAGSWRAPLFRTTSRSPRTSAQKRRSPTISPRASGDTGTARPPIRPPFPPLIPLR